MAISITTSPIQVTWQLRLLGSLVGFNIGVHYKKMQRFFHFLTNRLKINWLFSLSLLLLVFIPLYPKIPLFDVLPGYIVRVRVEDFLVVLTGVVWLYQILKRRIIWQSNYLWLVMGYGLAGLVSIGLGIFLLDSIPLQVLHIGKSGLHFFRYLEYFAIFFFLHTSIKTQSQMMWVIGAMVLTLTGVVGYGFGQKYLGLPLYSTMNREFSKGVSAQLQAGEKLQATFAGPYDLAAYLVIILPLIFSLALVSIQASKLRQIFWSGGLMAVHLAGVVTLFLTGSKAALLSYIIAMGVVGVFQLARLPNHQQRMLWAGGAIISGIILILGLWTILPPKTKLSFLSLGQTLTSKFSSISTAQRTNPVDLNTDGYENKLMASVSAEGITSYHQVKIKSDYSANALKYGLSMGIRLDTLWPQAMTGLINNPLSGNGYGTLSMIGNNRFAEADSTDNNFLRILGETGLLGFVSFFGLILVILKRSIKSLKQTSQLISALSIGLIGATMGLLVDALYIDVFAASKVAFTFWGLAGAITKMQDLGIKTSSVSVLIKFKQHILRHWPLYLVIGIAFFSLHQQPFAEGSWLKHLDQYPARLETLVSARCFMSHQTYNLCRATESIYRPFFSITAVLIVPFLWLSNDPGNFYFFNLSLIGVTLITIYLALRRFRTSSVIILTGLMVLVGLSYLLKLTMAPLTPAGLVTILVIAPLLSYGVVKALIAFKIKSWMIGLFLIIGGVLAIRQNNYFEKLLSRFQSTNQSISFHAVLQFNNYFDKTELDNNYLITFLNPYYVDLYTNRKYHTLPLSPTQRYMDQPLLSWGSLINQPLPQVYGDLLSRSVPLYVSNAGLSSDSAANAAFQDLKRQFFLQYQELGCQEQCAILKVNHAVKPISSNPPLIAQQTVDLNRLPEAYSFAVINNYYRPQNRLLSPELNSIKLPYLTSNFVLKLNQLQKNSHQFQILTGDLTESGQQEKVFDDFLKNQVLTPMIYNPNNYQPLTTQKDLNVAYFFTDQEFYILIEADEASQMTESQKIQFYNSLLVLEKLPNIKSLFIISDNLNWQNRSNPTNVVFLIEKKLSDFQTLTKHIITGDHFQPLETAHIKQEIDPKTGIAYWSSSITDNLNDAYIEVSIAKNLPAIVEIKSLNGL